MVFNYFIRAGYSQIQYTAYNFFVALYLAHDMEEDEEEPKNELFCWALGSDWSDQYRKFLKSRDDLWRTLGHRSVVSLSSCEKIMSIRPEHWAWQRFRPEVHAGANRLDTHSFCQSKLQRSHWSGCPLKEGSTASKVTSSSNGSDGDQQPYKSSVKTSREE
ncbi:speedy protein 1-A isoform X2 [Anabrus simplex]